MTRMEGSGSRRPLACFFAKWPVVEHSRPLRASVEVCMSKDNVNDLATLVGHHKAAEAGPVVHQASGILMARRGTTIEEAVAFLYEAAESRGVRVGDVAAGVVSTTPTDGELR
jgi:AmiR/NasT family two-component response regulator